MNFMGGGEREPKRKFSMDRIHRGENRNEPNSPDRTKELGELKRIVPAARRRRSSQRHRIRDLPGPRVTLGPQGGKAT